MIISRDLKSLRFPLALFLFALIPRLLSVFLLPNSFGDAYAYIKEIETLSAKISAGTFALTDLYGFWLPLYQLICAAISALVGHPFYVARIVSAICGALICVVCFEISLRLSANRKASLAVFALVALSPLHIFNSAAAMTDLPHACFVTASLFFVLKRQWAIAALMAALAGLTRVDSWMLIALIPALQLLEERRVSLTSIAIMACPPLFWFYISWKATGNWWACFDARKVYMDWLYTVNPSLATFSIYGIARDAGSLLISTDPVVLSACVVGTWIALKQVRSPKDHWRKPFNSEIFPVLKVSAFFFAFLSMLVFAYLTHKQAIIFPRYGLILFGLGAALLPWTYLYVTRHKPEWAKRLLVSIVVICILNAAVGLTYSIGYINREKASGRIAVQLRSQVAPGTNFRIFSDDASVVALSDIPANRFVSSFDAPAEREEFISWLRKMDVRYLVFVDTMVAKPARLFPELKEGRGNDMFRPVAHSKSRFLEAEIWLYEVQ